MPVYLLDDRLIFPPPEEAEDGLLAVGGDLSVERLLIAYARGIFPWYGEDQPILWHSPDPRLVLEPARLVVGRSLRKSMRRGRFEIRFDTAFEDVVRACAATPRPGQSGTWIVDDMIDAYVELHRRGFAHSAEAWEDGALCGGLYGVSLGGAFFGESMFAHRSDASKVAFVALVEQLRRWDFALIDCQQTTDLLVRFGATEWSRARFLAALRAALERPTRRGAWRREPA